MAQENINITWPNFCIAPLVGTFATVDTTNTNASLVVKNSTGTTTVSYTFNPNIPQNTTIYALEYIGPRNVTAFKTGMVFVTMESNTTSSVTIKKWNLNLSNSRLDLDYTITKSSSGFDTVASKAMAIGRYYTNLSATTLIGTGSITLNSVTNVVSGTRLYVGPSSNTSYLGNFEEVIATSVSGTTVFISSPSGTPLFSYYNSGDPVTYMGDMYLFSDVGYAVDTSTGSMLTINSRTGTTLDRHSSGHYNNVRAANFGLPFSNTVALVKNSQLLYIDVTDHSIVRSIRLNTTKPFNDTTEIVYAVAFTSTTIYRLQNRKVIRSDAGDYSTLNWTTYNYHEDSSNRYSDSISLSTDTIMIGNQETITIRVVVLDQYGMGISGKVVKFGKLYGDTGGVWGNVNSEATTDINGVGTITYTSNWYNPSLITPVNADIKITAYTDGSNILTGSIYIWTSMILKLNAKFLLDHIDTTGYGVNLVKQVIDSKTTTTNIVKQLPLFNSYFILKSFSKFKMPGGHEFYQTLPQVAIVKQLLAFASTLKATQKVNFGSTSPVKQLVSYTDNCPISQTVISRHLPLGSNQDNVFIAQFKFLIDAIPVPFSEKNNVNSTIWLRLAPYGFNLNKNTLVFKVKEISYTGDTGFVTYSGTPYVEITEFDAGGGLVGIEILFTPPEYFHNEAIVYVYLEIYDSAIPPNRIEFDYWFKVIPDYKAPFITNEDPAREATLVPVGTDISFDIIDTEVGVDITSLELYINNRVKPFVYAPLSNGYRITFFNDHTFYYGQTIEISVYVEDSSGQSNPLYDMWRFYLGVSEPPFIDPESFIPLTCSRGISSRTTYLKFNVYDEGSGLDIDSLELIVSGNTRVYSFTPIIKRIT